MGLFPHFYHTILQAFEHHHLRYLIVGGYATNFYGVIRSTIDLDLWVDRKEENMERMYRAFLSLDYEQGSCLHRNEYQWCGNHNGRSKKTDIR